MIDGFGDGIWLKENNLSTNKHHFIWNPSSHKNKNIKNRIYFLSFLWANTFDLQETTAKIRARTDHLKGLKIGIMGCIVNGPGEMADADYGYVGTGPEKSTCTKKRQWSKETFLKQKPLRPWLI